MTITITNSINKIPTKTAIITSSKTGIKYSALMYRDIIGCLETYIFFYNHFPSTPLRNKKELQEVLFLMKDGHELQKTQQSNLNYQCLVLSSAGCPKKEVFSA